jgi:hypothetical protein
MKIFLVIDRSGRIFKPTYMNQKEVFKLIDADSYDKKEISKLYPGEEYNEAVFAIKIVRIS